MADAAGQPITVLRAYIRGDVDDWSLYGWIQQQAEGIGLEQWREWGQRDPRDPSWTRPALIRLLIDVAPAADEVTPLLFEAEFLAEQLLRGHLAPIDFCRRFSELEVTALTVSDGTYPQVFHDLYNACDWCDAYWTLANSPHLRDAASRLLDNVRTQYGAPT